MTTRKLLWEMTWRGAVWGAITWLLGSFALVIIGYVLTPQNYGEQEFFGFVFLAIWFSLPIGMVVSAFLSAISGLLAGILSKRFFDPFKNLRHYQLSIVSISIILYELGGMITLIVLNYVGLLFGVCFAFYPLTKIIPTKQWYSNISVTLRQFQTNR